VRVLLVTEFFPDESSTGITGGVEARCFYLQRHLEADHDVQVLARFTDGTRWDFADIRSVPRRLAFLVGVVRKGLRAEADIVDASNVLVFPAAWVIARIKRKPIVFWYPDVLIGDWRSGMFGAGLIGEAVERIALRLPVQGYIAISEATARKLIAHGISKDQISVVPCGFEPSIVASAVAEPPPKTHTVCVVSRLVPYKRVDLVLDAVARLVPEHPDISLLVIGRGPEKDRLVDQAAGLGIADRVTFLGYVPSHQDVIRHIASAEIYVSASEIEGFGISVVEAMAVGTPYVVSRIDAFHEVTHGGQGGLLFAPGDGKGREHDLGRLPASQPARRGTTETAIPNPSGRLIRERFRQRVRWRSETLNRTASERRQPSEFRSIDWAPVPVSRIPGWRTEGAEKR
jgi:glycosyltransferase involved in cell wall biosynthesis